MAQKKKLRSSSIIFSIVADTMLLDEDQVTPGARFNEDLGADSIDFIEIVMGIEEKLGFDIGAITDTDAEKIRTVADLEKLVDARLGVAA